MFILKFRRAKYIPITIKQRLFKFQRIYIEILWDLRTNQRFKRKFKKWHVTQTVQLGEKESHINDKLPLRSKEATSLPISNENITQAKAYGIYAAVRVILPYSHYKSTVKRQVDQLRFRRLLFGQRYLAFLLLCPRSRVCSIPRP